MLYDPERKKRRTPEQHAAISTRRICHLNSPSAQSHASSWTYKCAAATKKSEASPASSRISHCARGHRRYGTHRSAHSFIRRYGSGIRPHWARLRMVRAVLEDALNIRMEVWIVSPQPSGDRDVDDEDKEEEEDRRRVRVVEAPRHGAARGEACRRRVAMTTASAAPATTALRATRRASTWRLVPSTWRLVPSTWRRLVPQRRAWRPIIRRT